MQYSAIFHFYRTIHKSLSLLILLVTLTTVSCSLVDQIQNTKQLLKLYEQKLQILLQMAEQQNISINAMQSTNRSNRPTSKYLLPKIQQHIIFQLPYFYQPNCRYLAPHFVVNGTQVSDIISNQIKYQLEAGRVISVEPYQITTLSDKQQQSSSHDSNSKKQIVITNFKQKIIQKHVTLALPLSYSGKWHHATKFQDAFMQIQNSTLFLTNSKQSKQFKLKSNIVSVYTINQYKILYVTRYQYGYMNPNSGEIAIQYNFDYIAENAYYGDGVLFVLLKNRTLLTISQESIISRNRIDPGVIQEGSQMQYLGQNYLIFYHQSSLCFDIFQISSPQYLLSHYKQICVADKFSKFDNQNLPKYRYQFFKTGQHFRFFISDTLTQTKMYQINIHEKQSTIQRSTPWKAILIVICVIAVVYFKSSRTKQKPNKQTYLNQTKKSVKKMRKQQNNYNNDQTGQQYVRQLTQEVKRAKKLQAQMSKNIKKQQ